MLRIGARRVLKGVYEVTYLAPDIEAYWDWLSIVTPAKLRLRAPALIQGRIGDSLVTLQDPWGTSGVLYKGKTRTPLPSLHKEKAHGAMCACGGLEYSSSLAV